MTDVAPAPASPAPPEPAQLRPSVDLARHMAGTFADPVRPVENLPGVLRSTPESDGLVIWGARADDSRVLVDGIEVPALLHVGSQRSAIGVHAPSSVELVPGAYGARYGRALGGLILIGTADLPADGVHGAADANLADASLMLSGAATSRFRVGLSGTWSYADHMPDRFAQRPTTFYGPARYRDFQAKAELDLSPQRRLTALILGATEAVGLNGDSLYYSKRLYPPHERTWYRVAIRYTDDRKNRILVMPFVGWTSDDLNSTDYPYFVADERHLHTLHYGLRAERQFWLGESAMLLASLDGLFERTRASQAGSPYFPRRTEDVDALSRSDDPYLAHVDWHATVGDVAASLSLRWQVGRWRLLPAFRADVFPTFVDSGISARGAPVTLGPRIAVEYLPHSSVGLHAAAGSYSQPATAVDLNPILGNPTLGPSQAAHGCLGASWHLTESTSVEATGFLRQSWNVAVRSSPAPASDGPRLLPDGRARAYGAELMIRKQVSARLDAWVAYTFSRSEIRRSETDPWILAPQDRTHALTAVFAHRWRAWLTSGRFRYTSGPPYEPVENATFDSMTGAYAPIYGAPNSARLRAFMQADLRIGREFHLGPGVGSIYLDITNATSHRNEEALLSYAYNYVQHSTINQPPRSYLLGARWQW